MLSCGQLEAGILKPNMVLVFVAVNVTTEVKSARRHGGGVSEDLPATTWASV